LNWQDLLEQHEPRIENVLPHEDQLASIMYSSGTTGTPKGVMLSFAAFGYVGAQVKKYLRIKTPQRFFSYLPLSHIAERALMEMVALSSGSAISFTESIEKFQHNLQHEQPTIFGGVPRIYAKFQQGVLRKIPQHKLDRLLKIPGLNILLRRMMIRKLGLAKAWVIVCGAAPTPVYLLEWFNKLGIEIRETYGMTENTAYSHSNFRLIRNGTVGQAWPGVDTVTEENGEILVRHPALMLGYYKDPVTTSRVLTADGFLRTGDQGIVDAQGFLTITGRIKDQFKTDKGKFVAPAPIELKLYENIDLEHVCVVGTGLPQPIALVTLSPNALKKPKTQVEADLIKQVANLNGHLEKHEQLRMTVIVADAWTIQNGLITPSMKIKRHAIEKRYSSRYNVWANSDGTVVWA
jgi:long-chain acyl-CoA synthetase